MALTMPRVAAIESASSALQLSQAIREVARDSAPEAEHRIVLDGVEITVSGNVFGVVVDVLARFAQRNAVMVGSADALLATSQAAEMAGVSRPFLCQLIDQGELAAEYIGTHRKIRLDDLTAYLQRRRASARAALNDVSKISRESGQYENDF